MNFLGLGQSASIEISLDSLAGRKMVEVKSGDAAAQRTLLPVFLNGESVSGKVTVSLKRGNRLEYQAIKIEFIGQIDFFADRGSRDEFVSLTQELARPGILSATTTYPFHFSDVEKNFESYSGSNVNLRYFLRVTVVKRFMDLTKEQDILVYLFSRAPQPDPSIQMEVGIEDSLHIEFEYNKSCYHLEDVIVGKIYFLLVRVKIKYMEIQILRRESTGLGVNTFADLETLAKFEIMDGAPVRGESIPIRLFLGCYELTPTMRDINRKFSVRYFLNLVLLDEEERRYYKQHEIFLYRKPEKRIDEALGDNGLADSVIIPPPLSSGFISTTSGDVTPPSPSTPKSQPVTPSTNHIPPNATSESLPTSLHTNQNGKNASDANAEGSDNLQRMESLGDGDLKAPSITATDQPDVFADLEDEELNTVIPQKQASSPSSLSRAERSFARYESDHPRQSLSSLPHPSQSSESCLQTSPSK